MMAHGTFTQIFHPNNEKLFDNASIDIIIFRYCKNPLLDKKTLYNGRSLHIINSNGLITFETRENNSTVMFGDYFDIYVGLVSGREEVYKNRDLGNIEVINGEDKIEKYIYIQEFPCDNPKINEYLLGHKDSLIQRRIRKFNEDNWFEWGAPRNITTINANLGKDCIYINTLTRNPKISFLGKVAYFGGGLLMLKPKKDSSRLSDIVSYINSDTFKSNFVFSGRFKIGHRQLSNSYIPIEYL